MSETTPEEEFPEPLAYAPQEGPQDTVEEGSGE